MSGRARLGILVSGRGSNMAALADACASGHALAEVALVVSNVPDAPGVQVARERGLEVAALDHRGMTREAFDADVTARLRDAGVTLVCLAGYMRLLSGRFVQEWSGRLLNIHPSLLPAFPGLNAQKQAIDHGVKVSGCTVHFVDEQLDNGPILLQEAVPVHDDDTVERLSQRILFAEHRLYPKAVSLLAAGRVRVEGRRAVLA